MASAASTDDASGAGVHDPHEDSEEAVGDEEEDIGNPDIVLDDPEEVAENADEVQQATQPDGDEEYAEQQSQVEPEEATGTADEQLESTVQTSGNEDENEPTTTTANEAADEEEQQLLQQQQNLLQELEEGEAYDAQQAADDAGSGGLTIDDADTTNAQQQHGAAPGTADYLTWNQILAHYFTLYPDPQSHRVYANGKPRIFVQCNMCGRKNDAKRGDPKTMVYHMKTYHPNLFVKLTEFRELIRTSTDPDELIFPDPFPEDMVAGEDDDADGTDGEVGTAAVETGYSKPTNNDAGAVDQQQSTPTARRQSDIRPSEVRQLDSRLAVLCNELGGNFPDNVIADTSNLTVWQQLLFCFTRKLPPPKNIASIQNPAGRYRFTHECMFCNKRFAGVDDGQNAQPLDHFAATHVQLYKGLLDLRASYDADDTQAFSDHRLQQLIDDEKVRSEKRNNTGTMGQPTSSTVTVADSGKLLNNSENQRRNVRFGDGAGSQPTRQTVAYAGTTAPSERLVLPPPSSSSGMTLNNASRTPMGTRRSGGASQQVVLQAPVRQQITMSSGNRTPSGVTLHNERGYSNNNAASSNKRMSSQPSNSPPYKKSRAGANSYDQMQLPPSQQRYMQQQQQNTFALPNGQRRGGGARSQPPLPQHNMPTTKQQRRTSPPTAAAAADAKAAARQVILVYYWLNIYDESNDSTLIMLPVMAENEAPPSVEHLKQILRQEGQELGDSASRFKLDSDGITVVDRLLSLGFTIVSQSHNASEMVWTMASV